MTYILIALVGASFIFEYWLLTKIGKLSKENQNLQTALMALNRDLTNTQAGISRDLEHTNKKIESNLGSIKRVGRKTDSLKRDIMNSLPTQIRKVIGHIEYAQPLDSSHGRG